MKLANRIFFSLIGIIIFGSLCSALIGSLLITRALKDEAFSRVENDLKSARLYLNDQLEELSLYSQLYANGLEDEIAMTISPNLSVLLSEEYDENIHKFFDYLRNNTGISLRAPGRGVTVIPLEILNRIGFNDDGMTEEVLCDDDITLWLYAVSKGELGISFSGILLSGNTQLVSELQEVLFGRSLYRKKPFGTITIFCADKRVSTTVIGPSGRIAVGTRVSEVVRKKVLEEGGMWLNRAYVVDDWYLSAYEPIRNPLGENIGILYVGVLEQKYLDIRNRAVAILSGIVFPTLGFLIFGVFLISKNIVRPISELAEASQRIAGGKLDTRVLHTGHISELKTLLKSFNRMVSAIKKREKMLLEKNTLLEEANRDYQELLSFVTHELNNSIGSLLLNVSLLTDGTLGEIEGELNEVAQQVLRDVERFRDMVRNYLNISRLEKGTLKYRPETINMKSGVVEPVLRRLSSRIDHKGIEIYWDWKEEALVSVDTDLMDICYSNLIINALKYGKDWIRLTAERGETTWIFGVENGGVPIPKEKIPLLFKKFSRLVKSDDGAGLGLYLVQKILEQHGGDVWCESEGGKGTGFFMKIPINE